MLTAFTSALDEVEGNKAKADLCLWVAERGFLGVAYTQGLRAAAESAYRLGDKLAGVSK
jgi:hypothetical protein